MSRRRRVALELREAVRERASGLCEYCHASERWQYVEFTVDHIGSFALLMYTLGVIRPTVIDGFARREE